MNKVKIGVIGVGYLGYYHAQKYAAMEGVELVGVADISSARSAEAAKDYQTRSFTDFHQLLPLVDGVSVVVPTRYHFTTAMACLKAGVDVMLEKPMTVTLDEADELVEIAADKKRILQVGHLERFNPAVVAMTEHLTEPFYIESQRIHQFNPRGADVDVISDLMIHDLDLVLSMIDAPLEEVHPLGASIITRETDIAGVQLVFANGCRAEIRASRASHTNIRMLQVFQPGGSIRVDYGTKELTLIETEGKFGEDGLPVTSSKTFDCSGKDALEDELRHFVSRIRDRKTPRVDGRAGRDALALALRISKEIKQQNTKTT